MIRAVEAGVANLVEPLAHGRPFVAEQVTERKAALIEFCTGVTYGNGSLGVAFTPVADQPTEAVLAIVTIATIHCKGAAGIATQARSAEALFALFTGGAVGQQHSAGATGPATRVVAEGITLTLIVGLTGTTIRDRADKEIVAGIDVVWVKGLAVSGCDRSKTRFEASLLTKDHGAIVNKTCELCFACLLNVRVGGLVTEEHGKLGIALEELVDEAGVSAASLVANVGHGDLIVVVSPRACDKSRQC